MSLVRFGAGGSLVSIEPNSKGLCAIGSDDVGMSIGEDDDIVVYHRSSTLGANTALTNVLEGTPVTPALAANSLIISNITNDGDILIAGSDGGNSKASLFFDASAGDTYLYHVGGTWTAGGSTWTIPAVTLGGTITLNGQVFDAGSGWADFITSGGDNGIRIKGSDVTHGPALRLYHNHSTPLQDTIIGDLKFMGYDGAGAADYIWGYIQHMYTNVADGSEESRYEFYSREGDTLNKVAILSGGGELQTDLDSDITANATGADIFDDYDDVAVMELASKPDFRMREKGKQALIRMGVATDDGKGNRMISHDKVRMLTWGGIRQNRVIINELMERIESLERRN